MEYDPFGRNVDIYRDDIERENGNLEKANIMKQLCQDNNWEAISMKDDWKTIYGSNVKRNLTSK